MLEIELTLKGKKRGGFVKKENGGKETVEGRGGTTVRIFFF